MSPNVNPPANAAPLLRSSLRLVRFESISPSFERNDTTTKSRARGREHMPPCQIWPVLMSRGLRILKRQLVRGLLAAWRVGADHPQAQPSSVRNRGYAIRAVVSECVSRSYSPSSGCWRLICGRHALRLGLLHRGLIRLGYVRMVDRTGSTGNRRQDIACLRPSNWPATWGGTAIKPI